MLCPACQNPALPIKARGLCRNCYQRWLKTGSTERQKMKRGPCIIEGCTKMAHGRGMCHMHLRRERVLGSTADPRIGKPKPLPEYDLYPQWADFLRLQNPRPVVPEWKANFHVFLAAVGDRPSKQHRLYRLDKRLPMGPGNFEWRDTLTPKLPGETKQEYNKRASRAHKELYPEDRKEHQLQRAFGKGFTLERYNMMAEAQDNKCAICRQPETVVKYGKVQMLCVDHSHAHTTIRKLLCQACNQGLGNFRDRPDVLRAAAAYLEEFHGH